MLLHEELLISDIQHTICGLLKGLSSPTVVELGAFHGEDSAWISPLAARYIALEPDPRNAEYFRLHRDSRSASYDGVSRVTEFLEMAIAPHSGLAYLHLCKNDEGRETASSSIRRPTGHLKHFPWCKFPFRIAVRCLTLDHLYQEQGLEKVDLLWVDIQGAERDMIEGGREALCRTRWLFMEAEETEMYEGQALREELLGMLPSWEVEREFDYNLLLKNRACA